MNIQTRLAEIDQLIVTLTQRIGAEHVITDEAERAYYSMDVYEVAEPCALVLRPGSVEEAAEAVRLCADAGLAITPRGGGLSYTNSVLPAAPDTAIIDITRLNRVVEINETDMTVTVECGASWAQLYEAVSARGLRTPYWGALSGLESTVGGALSQNSVFLGSGRWGTAAEQVLSLDVALADGTLLTTGGSAATEGGTPFMRQYGPDLNGIFLADSGTLGLKLRATLKLIPMPAAKAFASFTLSNHADLVGVMSQIAREGLAAECYAFDPAMQSMRILGAKPDLKDDLGTLTKVLKASGVKEATKMVFAGRHFAKKMEYGLHVLCEERSQAAADEARARVVELAKAAGGVEVDNTVPKAVAANPFTPPDSMLGPEGERWVPVHGIVPHSKAKETIDAMERMFAEHDDLIRKNEIKWGYLTCTVGYQGFLIEPVLFWPDARTAYHDRRVRQKTLANLPSYEANAEASKAAALLREECKRFFREHAAVHFQIGRSYPFRESRDGDAWKLLEGLKALIDPKGRMNPGALGFD